MSIDKAVIARAVGPERYERGRQIAWATASRAGQMLQWTPEERTDDQELYDIVDQVQAAAFDEADTPNDMTRKVCELYADFPSYTMLSQLFMTIGLDGLSEREMTDFYRFLAAMLSAEAEELAQPAAYLLWVDFFEDPQRVDAAWREVTAAISSDRGWRRLLQESGPVPERLKAPLIERLISDSTFHEAIFEAIVGGVFDVYGQMERATADSLLARLRGLDTGDPRYADLRERLADPFPIEIGWRLKRHPGC